MNDLLIFLVTNVASGAVSAIGSDALNTFLNQIGLGNLTGGAAAYQKQVLADLAAIQTQLTNVSAAITEVAGAETKIEESITDAGLSAELQNYDNARNQILPVFQSWTNAVAVLADNTASQSDQQAAAGNLYELMRITQMDDIATAMLDIHDFAMGKAEQQGLIQYQTGVISEAVYNWASEKNGSNLVNSATGWSDFRDGSQVLSNMPSIIKATVAESVLPTFQDIITAQAQGFLLLNAAWQNGPNASLLSEHQANIQAQLTAMVDILLVQGTWLINNVLNYALYGTYTGSPLMTTAEAQADKANYFPDQTWVWWAYTGELATSVNGVKKTWTGTCPGAYGGAFAPGYESPSWWYEWDSVVGTSPTDYHSDAGIDPANPYAAGNSVAFDPFTPTLQAILSVASGFLAGAVMPTAPTVAPAVPPTDGAYWNQPSPDVAPWVPNAMVSYGVSFVNGGLESPVGPMSDYVSCFSYAYAHLTNVPTGPAGIVTARNIYRQFQGESSPTLVGQVPDNGSINFSEGSQYSVNSGNVVGDFVLPSAPVVGRTQAVT